MPRPTRAPEDIEAAKTHILDTAAEIICESGFDSLSMRKLAARLNMTAANIYNYYSNQDELYLNIQIRGFSRFAEQFSKTYEKHHDPVSRMKALIHVYLDFGLNNPGYYEIMLDSNTPRYTEYVESEMEPLAFQDKALALNLLETATRVFEEIDEMTGVVSTQDASYKALLLWTSLHGIVTLFNRDILKEVSDTPQQLIERMADDLLRQFSGQDA